MFTAKRISTHFQITIDCQADDVFALACPKEELKWIDHWQYDMIFSESGKNETNCIFKEKMSGLFVVNEPGMETIWHTTLYDPIARIFHSLLLFGDVATAKFEFAVTADSRESATADWGLTFTTLNDRGNQLADEGLKERLFGMLNFLGESAKHYLETGNMLKVG
jgi:hypothetical protein